ncbi:low temperature requirement protein A [Streptosporangium sp. 'caverna']|uniref:low temperature requirement protein A n=1 Tax=Streptosporangium sp. 'caverna' TaxID=2202249 RepID=UPI000D7DB2A9|nr:low temperature requirement protein A [Streptosporangium sp. 'caverna']AWS47471.1 low temperature requirement protein A [Streptosporangium sp. 'caverna']
MSDQPVDSARQPGAMSGRDPHEPHWTVTRLELFFDLVSVVAMGQAVEGLHHAIIGGHVLEGVAGYAAAFFAIWWAWVNWTWFSSAFDNDDTIYRISAFVQMFGALVLAAGVARAFEGDFGIAVGGYAVMRLALAGQWLRAAATNPGMRPMALRFAAGIAGVQILWIARLAVPGVWAGVAFVLLCLVEMVIPWWAERERITPWHPRHIAERYMLFSVIVLGGTVFTSMIEVSSGVTAGAPFLMMILVGVSGLAVVCSMWWLYNARPAPRLLYDNRQAFIWSYGHYFVFASIAAFGAGFAAIVDLKIGPLSDFPVMAVRWAVAIPVALFLISVWFVHIRPHRPRSAHSASYLVAAPLILLVVFTPTPLELTALIMIGTVFATELTRGDP